MKNKYSIFSLIKNAFSYHENWEKAWKDPIPKKEYDAIIIGGGGHGLATAYYLAKKHDMKNIAVVEKGLGMGIWGTPNSSQTVSIVPKNTYGSVAALINLIRTVGMGISIAISSSLITLAFINLGLNSDFSSSIGVASSSAK